MTKTKKLRILYVNPFLAFRDGSAIHAHAFVKAANRNGVEVVTFPQMSSSIMEGYGNQNGIILNLKKKIPRTITELGRLVVGFERTMIRFSRVLFINEGYDIVLARPQGLDFTGLMLAKLNKIPLVLELNAPYFIESKMDGYLGVFRFIESLEIKSWMNATRVAVVSNDLKKIIKNSGVSADKIDVIPNGVDPDIFRVERNYNEARSIPGIDRNDFVICFTGSLMPWHGVNILLQSIQILRQKQVNIKLLIIGSGQKEEDLKLEASFRGIGSSIIWLGPRPHHEIPRLLGFADVCVAPYPLIENFYFSPIKVFEYMAAGKPVIASRQGQLVELLGTDRGVLVEPSNPIELADAICDLKKNPQHRKVIANKAKEYVFKKYTWRNNAERIIRCCEKAIEDYKS